MTKIHLSSNNISKKTSLIDKQEHLKKERYVFLDILKIIAMICVIYYHSNARSIFPSEIYNFIAGFLSSCVPIFFMVNGALLLNKEMDLKKHVRKTIKSLWLTVLWSFIIIIAVIPILGFEDFSIVNFIKGVFVNKHGYSHYLWFMVQLTIIYLIFPLIKYLFDNSKVYFVFICGFCIILAYGTSLTRTFIMCFDKLLGTGNIISEFIGFGYGFLCKFDITTKSYPFALSIFMFGGILFYYLIKNKEKLQSKKTIINILASGTLIIGLLLSYMFNISLEITDAVFDGYNSIYTLLITTSLFILCFINDRKRTNKILNELSSNFFGIYMIHTIFIVYIPWAFNLINFSIVPKEVCAICIFAVSFIISYFFRRVKYVKNLFKL